MSIQEELKEEERRRKKRNALAKALDNGLPDVLEMHGVELHGIAIRYDAYSCLMTLRVSVGGVRKVSFVGSDTMINCFLKAYRDAAGNRLVYSVDKFAKD